MNTSTYTLPNSNLNQVLQSFQIFAMKALGGPALWNAARFESYKAAFESFQSGKDIAQPLALPFDFKLPAQLPSPSNPILMRPDSRYERSEYVLEGELIACFEVGGEKRLCLPRVLQTVLGRFTLEIIRDACDDLNIYCSTCSPEQLEFFKRNGNLLASAPSCGLITLTDAERLCSVLLHKDGEVYNNNNNNYLSNNNHANTAENQKPSETNIPVYHECFGEGYGFLRPDLYSMPSSPCIVCADCGQLFSPSRFVGHSHKSNESRVCHWGFDRNKWRSYLIFAEDDIADSTECDRLADAFDRALQRFDEIKSLDSTRKRKASGSPDIKEEELTKLRRFSDSQVTVNQSVQNVWLPSPPLTFPLRNGGWPTATISTSQTIRSTPTPTKMRLPTQKSCPPTLENPDRVVPSCESSRYEKHFVPNIALQQSNDLQGDDDVEVDNDVDSVQGVKLEAKDNTDSVESCPLSKDSSGSSTCTSSTYTAVLENLAKMEYQYLQLLQSSNLSQCERDRMEQRYISYSDSIRREVVPEVVPEPLSPSIKEAAESSWQGLNSHQ